MYVKTSTRSRSSSTSRTVIYACLLIRSGGAGRDRLARCRPLGVRRQRQGEAYGCATLRIALQSDRAAVCLDDGLGDGEPETGAGRGTRRAAGAEVPLEQLALFG